MRLRWVRQRGGPTFASLACTPALPNLSTPRLSILPDFLLGTPYWSCFPLNKTEHNKAFASLGSGSIRGSLIRIDELKVSPNWQVLRPGGSGGSVWAGKHYSLKWPSLYSGSVAQGSFGGVSAPGDVLKAGLGWWVVCMHWMGEEPPQD